MLQRYRENFRIKLAFLREHPAYRKAPLRTLFRIVLWRLRCWGRLAAEIELPRFGVPFYLPPRWGGEGTTLVYVAREDFELELTHLDRFVASGDVVVDAGACCGIYTVVAGKLVGETGRVIAFEPSERVLPIIRRNIEINRLANVRLFPCALTDVDGTIKLYHHHESGPVAYSTASSESEPEQYEEVPAITLDTALAREGLGHVDFIKMDIEGAEAAALRGADNLLSNRRPVVVFEMNRVAADRFGIKVDAAWQHLQAFGYDFFTLDLEGRLHALKEPPPEVRWEFFNVIAIHPESRDRFDFVS